MIFYYLCRKASVLFPFFKNPTQTSVQHSHISNLESLRVRNLKRYTLNPILQKFVDLPSLMHAYFLLKISTELPIL